MGVTPGVNADSPISERLRNAENSSRVFGVTTNTTASGYIGVRQLAERLGVSASTALRRCQSGEIPAIQMPGRTGTWVINLADLPPRGSQGDHDNFAA